MYCWVLFSLYSFKGSLYRPIDPSILPWWAEGRSKVLWLGRVWPWGCQAVNHRWIHSQHFTPSSSCWKVSVPQTCFSGMLQSHQILQLILKNPISAPRGTMEISHGWPRLWHMLPETRDNLNSSTLLNLSPTAHMHQAHTLTNGRKDRHRNGSADDRLLQVRSCM